MPKLQPIRGTRDILPEERSRFRHIEEVARELALRYGYLETATPILEFSEVFKKTLGETSDVVKKEMYTFTDKGGDEVTLRPEGTAGIARMLISGGLTQDLPLKFFYQGPMFRYERPQKGRFRQFHQIGVELLGVPEPLGDIEVIALGSALLEKLGIREKTTLHLNTLGTKISRGKFKTQLITYLNDFRSTLSVESRERIKVNPLRILDSKDANDKEILANAPRLFDSLDSESLEFFETVKEGLDHLGISYQLDSKLVRGLDYYCHTAFEFITPHLGAQGAVLAGGRYDGLVGQMGGTETAGIGWAGGIERLSLLTGTNKKYSRTISVIPVVSGLEKEALSLAVHCRAQGLAIDLGFRGNLSRRLKRASKLNAIAAVIMGPEEMNRGFVIVRNLDTGKQEDVAMTNLIAYLERYQHGNAGQ
ncbi:MAG: histidine--tRNA ligase [Pseudomonadota bacterium]|nr:histidine--tRNA ligase [Pseudomonadota bacterium]